MNRPPPTPVVSVVILNWNAASWIPRCLESMRQQTIFAQLEIIFADNASSDDSEKIARELGWKPQYTNLDAILASAWQWHQQRYSLSLT